MRAINLQRAVRIVLLAGVGVLTAGQASASGFALAEQNSSGLGNAYAGAAAVAEDASTIFFNSAGLSQISRPSLLVNAAGININSNFHNTASSTALGQPLGGTGSNAGDYTVLPALYFATPIAWGLSAGLGVNAPFGLKTEYDGSWMGRFQAIKSDVKTKNINLAVAYQLNKMISLGVGVDYQKINATLTSAVNYDAVVAQGLTSLGQQAAIASTIQTYPGLEGVNKVKGDDSAMGFDVGVLLKPSEQTRIGLSYRSAIKYTIGGNVTITAPPATTSSTVNGIIGLAKQGTLADGPVMLNIKLPASARVGVVQEVGNKVEVMGEVMWTQWSTVKELRVLRTNGVTLKNTPENWRNTMRYSLGANYQVMDYLKLRLGAALDQSPVKDTYRTPRLPDADRTWASAGGRFDINETLSLDVGYTHVFVKDASLNQNDGNTSASGLLVGNQKTSIDILGAQVSVNF